MPVVAVIGAQWGDEGKGRIVDVLADRARLVIRYGGGNNAGHTVINQYGTFKIHLVPSGIFDTSTVNIIGSGVVIDPGVLLKEIADLHESGINTDKLFISDRAQVIMPYHVLQDQLDEMLRGDQKIGTTGRGIGPAYADKMSRIGIRVGDLLQEDVLLKRLQFILENKNRLLTSLYKTQELSLHEIYLQYLNYGRQLANYVADTHPIIHRALEKDVPILLEGAQGALLDIDHGTYPYVTSSAPGAAGACQGAGIGPTQMHSVIGVYKAYSTRVGEGPFPTELEGDAADVLRQIGKPWAEVGTTTGRLRRVGWFDAVLARYTAQINGVDTVAITKLDVLDTMPSIQVCTGYRMHDTELDYPPGNPTTLSQVEPIYEEFPGWMQPTSDIRYFEHLPKEAQAYVARLCELIGVRIGMVSVGPEREQIIEVNPVL
ncbi:MAG: adenylosuccinate synthase [Chloroflexi bacterium AL-W]|nr:adenylosuccinate synthase [Chloroflexi bacterium AL-N1]NOK65869.1 adenylosuccinate synthase [Chloroflexi bacterium AL-N10]NOK74190.1 adenylosuccinate synthase [Chloroflexi bacterium AL-N5]NOK80902.1 adenylosuccinate synthase [Chloroflexi bacterium AL-W]NOK88448.1 adenylosuccinate synthase [Chloroflexi bacterium AL-N15]